MTQVQNNPWHSIHIHHILVEWMEDKSGSIHFRLLLMLDGLGTIDTATWFATVQI